jgi:hypothetical protein
MGQYPHRYIIYKGKIKDLLRPFANATVIKSNVIEDDLPGETGRIAVCNLDVDMYEAVSSGLQKLAPMVCPGGIIVAEDQGHTPSLSGAYLTLVEFLKTSVGNQFIPVHMASGQMFLIKK